MSQSPLLFICHSGAVATTASTLKSIVAVRGTSTQEITLQAYKISMDRVTADTPCLVEVMRFSALGTSSGTPTAVKFGSFNDRAANGVPLGTWSVEPTRGDVLDQYYLSPNSPTWQEWMPFAAQPNYDASATHAIGISVTPASGSTPNVRVSLVWAE